WGTDETLQYPGTMKQLAIPMEPDGTFAIPMEPGTISISPWNRRNICNISMEPDETICKYHGN
ncbi:hypothetical protein TNIN_164991, partial [Trichonephila inaurata madagascariensis]